MSARPYRVDITQAALLLHRNETITISRRESDIDVAVLLERDPPLTLDASAVALGGDIQVETGLPIDLVILNRAPVDLIHRVLRDGVLLVERDRNARVRFEVKARSEYFDLKPHLDRYRRVAERSHGRQ